MRYLLCVFTPDPEPLEDFEELEGAVERCDELVHAERYGCVELWDGDGALVYRAGRRPGTFTRSTPSELASRPPASSRPAAAGRAGSVEQERRLRVVRDEDRHEGLGDPLPPVGRRAARPSAPAAAASTIAAADETPALRAGAAHG